MEPSDLLRQAGDFLFPHDAPVEFRPIDDAGKRRSGFYTDRAKLVEDAIDFAGKGCQWTINPLSGVPVTNELAPARKDGCAKKAHVSRICNLPLDFDPVRPSGQEPSTDSEHEASLAVANIVVDALTAKGWPLPLIIDSGNGTQVFYPTDLPPNLEPLVKAFVECVKATYETPEVVVDDSVYKLNQLMRVPETWSRKGSSTPERPHRKSHVLSCPQRELVSADLLAQLVAFVPTTASDYVPDDYEAAIAREIAWLESRKVAFTGEKISDDQTILRLGVCPHKTGKQSDGRAWISIHRLYGVNAGCFHAKCKGKELPEFRKAIGGHAEFIRADIGLTAGPTDPHYLAAEYIDATKVGDHPTTLHIGEDLLIWRNGLYEPKSDKALIPFVTAAVKESADQYAMQASQLGGKSQPFPVTRKIVGDVMNAVKSLSRAIDREPPCWLADHAWQPSDVIPFKNGLLHWPSWLAGGECFIASTPAFFNRHQLGFDFNANAPQPNRWLQFLNELWDDPACHDLAHEWGGYCMTRDTSLQKMMGLLGALRGGKGTYCWTLGTMAGGNFASPTFKSLLTQFGIQPLEGKQLIIFPESQGTSASVLRDVTEILKLISGEDFLTYDRKYRGQIHEKLRGRITYQSNEILVFPDNSGAMQGRQLYLSFTRSFLGREDFQLKEKLTTELSGIANLFLAGLRRLRENGGVFTEPESSKQLAAEVFAEAVPLAEFVAERCELAPDCAERSEDVYQAYLQWAGSDAPLENNEFGKQLRQVARTITKTVNVGKFKLSKQSPKGSRRYYYTGIKLKAA